ncbi:MAG: MFS transporter [Bacteroidetes bacterium 4484_276]|nr:MAG: MFS transporter [Bacteroidetes bacterium 4484_276]
MFKGHPKGLIAAALANMGERFGFYTMMAILSLFIVSKFGLDVTTTGYIYATFYALIYILSLVGGIIADKTKNFKGTILVGLVVMSLGYLIMAVPTPTPVPNLTLYLTITLVGLFVIAFGNGLFKGNLQALVGQMYDQGNYSDEKRGSGFQIFYMFINIGAVVAPFIAPGIRTWWLKQHNFLYNAELPALCHSQLNGTISADSVDKLQTWANDATISGQVTDLTAFANNYLNIFTEGFHYAFGIAILAMAISFVIYLYNKKRFPDPGASVVKTDDKGNIQEIKKMDIKEVRRRIYALLAVYGVVIFFWFSFHQNGLTLTFFARDYTVLKFAGFNLSVESFQAMNPFFVVFLTPVIVGLFGWLKNKGIEPSTPKKIAIGMFIAAMAYVLMSVGSMTLPLYSAINPETGGTPLDDIQKVTPLLLLGTYFILTVAELFISPLGIAFVSKVAPPQYQGLMQGGWLGATALGNQLLFIGAILYTSIPLWITWGVFVGVCLISMTMMLFMLKWLERVSA